MTIVNINIMTLESQKNIGRIRGFPQLLCDRWKRGNVVFLLSNVGDVGIGRIGHPIVRALYG